MPWSHPETLTPSPLFPPTPSPRRRRAIQLLPDALDHIVREEPELRHFSPQSAEEASALATASSTYERLLSAQLAALPVGEALPLDALLRPLSGNAGATRLHDAPPVAVNSKQYQRIVKRRETRSKLEYEGRLPRVEKVSRAMAGIRPGPQGKCAAGLPMHGVGCARPLAPARAARWQAPHALPTITGFPTTGADCAERTAQPARRLEPHHPSSYAAPGNFYGQACPQTCPPLFFY